MARFFLSRDGMDLEHGIITITGDDAHHIAYSLRMAVGDALTVCDMQKTEYLCEITEIRPTCVTLRVNEEKQSDTELPISLHLYQSIPKGDKMDYIVQKAVELGITDITPVKSARCIVNLDAKGAENKCRRWQRIAEEAAKQCGRGCVPTVHAPLAFEKACAMTKDIPAIFCYEGDGTVSLKTIVKELCKDGVPKAAAFFIGPEGGYDIKEVERATEQGMHLAGLGKRILRCETASGFVLAAIAYEIEL